MANDLENKAAEAIPPVPWRTVPVDKDTPLADEKLPKPDGPEVFRISGAAYLRAMWSILWSVVAHPCRTTVIDATTGEVLYRY
jgi:hypothetical protein